MFGANYTNGGEGTSGFQLSKSKKKQLSVRAIEQWKNPIVSEKMKINQKLVTSSKEFSEKIRKAKLEHWQRIDYREKFLAEKNPNAKLTHKIVKNIRRNHELGTSKTKLAIDYSLCYKTIWRIVTNRIWVQK